MARGDTVKTHMAYMYVYGSLGVSSCNEFKENKVSDG